jgi:hypothetical protein
MRSKSLGIDLDRATPTGVPFQVPAEGRRSVSISPNGQVTFNATLVLNEDKVEYHEETFHLDTDEGFARFVELITESAVHAKVREIKKTLYIG